MHKARLLLEYKNISGTRRGGAITYVSRMGFYEVACQAGLITGI